MKVKNIFYITIILFLSFIITIDKVNAATGNTMNDPIIINYGSDYTKSWTNSTDHLNHYNKLTLTEKGIVKMTFSKPFDSDSEYGKLLIAVFDSEGEMIWNTKGSTQKDNAKTNYIYYIGLDKGDYYVTVKPGFSVISGLITTNYSFDFTANEYTETEPNESAKQSTLLNINKQYTGYYGYDYGDVGENDYYKFNASYTKEYKINISNIDSMDTTLIYLYAPNGEKVSIKSRMKPDQNGDYYYNFTPAYDGIYYLEFTNYSKKQIKYDVGIYSNPTVTWKDYDGKILDEGEILYGAYPAYPNPTPTRPKDNQYTYTFIGWDKELTPVLEDVTYTAIYDKTLNKYKVTFVDNNGTILKEAKEYDYGTLAKDIEFPSTPTKPGCTFLGWYQDANLTTPFDINLEVTNNITIYAKWEIIESELIKVYRMYNPVNGEHLYTTDAHEVDVIFKTQGWGKEGIGWYTAKEGIPVYRLYNPRLGNHLYTSDRNEINIITRTQGWVLDFNGEPVMYASGDIPIYRLFNPGLQGQHHLTTDFNEYKVIPKWGWQPEGTAMYAQKIGVPETTHYYR